MKGLDLQYRHIALGLLCLIAMTRPANPFAPTRAFILVGKGRRKNVPLSVAARNSEETTLMTQAHRRKRDAISLAKNNDYSNGLENIRFLFSMLESATDDSSKHQLVHIITEAIVSFTDLAFSKPFRGATASRRVNIGLEALQLQLSSLPAPYDEVPSRTFVVALRALSAVISNGFVSRDTSRLDTVSADDAFRILQRLLTGIGVRNNSSAIHSLSERDFNAILNSVVNCGRMDVAEKVVALQERTPHAPRLSRVTYSILLKGYGKQGNVQLVESVLEKAYVDGIVPDTVMLNSVLDAMINCNEVAKAQGIFEKSIKKLNHVRPNIRTYNTMLKGFAKRGALGECISLTEAMREQHLWDPVTTNTLVSAAIAAGNFSFAESVLVNHTEPLKDEAGSLQEVSRRDHPNIEGYTTLLDGFAKAGNLDKALGTLEHMRKIGVTPNEYSYTCMIAGLARRRRVAQATKLLKFMESRGVKPTVVTYNAFMSALVADEGPSKGSLLDEEVTVPRFLEDTMNLLRRMVKNGVCPTVSTISILLEAFAKCPNPRVQEATAIVKRFERDEIIPLNDRRINTAMIKVYGAAQDVMGALAVFRRIKDPDVVSINAFLAAACRGRRFKVAMETFDHLFSPKASSLLDPDVVTFSTLISYQLRLKTLGALRTAEELYHEMRKRGIVPDVELVDRILSEMIRRGRPGLQEREIRFTLRVLRDAELISWEQGELEQRKQNVRALVIGRMREVWKEKEDYCGLNNGKIEDELFHKKGWNKMDSGFRMWGTDGSSISFDEPDQKPIDEFLASKGWNGVDSSFRFF